MEKNEAVFNNGDGNSYTTEFRQYDPRLGRWLSYDPLAYLQPDQSPYKAFYNNPNKFVDTQGGTEYEIEYIVNYKTGKVAVKIKVVSADVMTDGVKHSVYTTDPSGLKENYYYDFVTVKTTIKDKNGNSTTQSDIIILKNEGVKDKDWVIFGGDAKYDRHSEWKVAPDKGKEVSFGIEMTGTGGGSAVKQDHSKNAIGDMNFDELQTILANKSITGGPKYTPGEGSWRGLDSKKWKDWVKAFNNGKDGAEKVGEAADKTIEEANKGVQLFIVDVTYRPKDGTGPWSFKKFEYKSKEEMYKDFKKEELKKTQDYHYETVKYED
jgi:RHS repeat-associated protein